MSSGSAKAAAVIVVGSLHYDIMVDAPDRPRRGETVTGYRWRPKFGGKGGNQAVAAARAGVDVRFVGAVGTDDFGPFLRGALSDAGVNCTYVATLADIGSGMSVAITDDGGDYGAVIVSGANTRIDGTQLADDKLWEGAALLLLQNEVPADVNLQAASAAKARDVPVWLNAAPMRLLPDVLVALVDGLVVNAIEAEQMCGVSVVDLPSAEVAARALSQRFGYVVVTAGSAGVVGIAQGAEPVRCPALPVKLVSTHGAGDAFVGTLVAGLARGEDFAHGLTVANEAAARHVSTPVA